MLSRAVNGFTAAQVEDAILGKSGVIERKLRFQLHDRFGNYLRETRSVREGGGIKYDDKQSIRRGGSIQIDEKAFTLTDDYLDPNAASNLELWMPTLYSQITHESAIAFWRLGESSGTSATDSTGNSHTGTYTGGVTLNDRGLCEAALTNGSALFDGTNDYVVIADHAAFDVSNMSAEAWMKSSYTGARQTIISRDDVSTNRQFILRTLGTADTGMVGYVELVLFFTGAVTVRYTAPVNVCDGNNHHIVATYNGINVDIYVDGVRVLRTAETRAMLLVNTSMHIGALGGAVSTFFNGNLDEVAFYGYALSPAQVRNRYQAGSGQLYEIDFLHDQIKCFCAIKMPTVGTDLTRWAEFSRGMFSFVFPDRDEDAMGAFYSGLIQDLTAKLENTTVRSANYTISTVKKYRQALEDLFTGAGFSTSQYSIATSTVAETTLPLSKEYSIGTTYLFIMNELLREMNYRQASANSDGIILLDAWTSSGNRATEFTLSADANSIIRTELKQSTNLKDVYNEIFLKRQGAKGVQELVATAQITNASHPMSFARLGYFKTYSDINVTAASQTVIDDMAVRLREEKGRIAYRLNLSTPLLCILDNDDYLRVLGIPPPPLFSSAFSQAPENFLITSWEESFDDTADAKLDCEFYLAAA